MDAYLDIEFSYRRLISVVGVFRPDTGFRQLVGARVSGRKILELLEGVKNLVTFNGDCCEIPVIRKRFGIDLKGLVSSFDLMKECRKRGLLGKCKAIEKELGIPRRLNLTGRDAMNLYYWYEREGDRSLLYKLLDYNREDVMNLVGMHKILLEMDERAPVCAS